MFSLNVNNLPPAFQKVPFQAPKDDLSDAERAPFAMQYAAFWKTAGKLQL